MALFLKTKKNLNWLAISEKYTEPVLQIIFYAEVILTPPPQSQHCHFLISRPLWKRCLAWGCHGSWHQQEHSNSMQYNDFIHMEGYHCLYNHLGVSNKCCNIIKGVNVDRILYTLGSDFPILLFRGYQKVVSGRGEFGVMPYFG